MTRNKFVFAEPRKLGATLATHEKYRWASQFFLYVNDHLFVHVCVANHLNQANLIR